MEAKKKKGGIGGNSEWKLLGKLNLMKSHYFSSKLEFPSRNFSLHCDKFELRGREREEKGAVAI